MSLDMRRSGIFDFGVRGIRDVDGQAVPTTTKVSDPLEIVVNINLTVAVSELVVDGPEAVPSTHILCIPKPESVAVLASGILVLIPMCGCACCSRR